MTHHAPQLRINRQRAVNNEEPLPNVYTDNSETFGPEISDSQRFRTKKTRIKGEVHPIEYKLFSPTFKTKQPPPKPYEEVGDFYRLDDPYGCMAKQTKNDCTCPDNKCNTSQQKQQRRTTVASEQVPQTRPNSPEYYQSFPKKQSGPKFPAAQSTDPAWLEIEKEIYSQAKEYCDKLHMFDHVRVFKEMYDRGSVNTIARIADTLGRREYKQDLILDRERRERQAIIDAQPKPKKPKETTEERHARFELMKKDYNWNDIERQLYMRKKRLQMEYIDYEHMDVFREIYNQGNAHQIPQRRFTNAEKALEKAKEDKREKDAQRLSDAPIPPPLDTTWENINMALDLQKKKLQGERIMLEHPAIFYRMYTEGRSNEIPGLKNSPAKRAFMEEQALLREQFRRGEK